MIPNSFTLGAIQESFRDLYAKLNKWLTGNVDLSGRRITNAGSSVDPSDYITKDELTKALNSITKATAAVSTNSTNGGTTVPVGGPLRSTSPIRVGAYAFIGTAIAHPQEAYVATDRNYSVYYSDGATWTDFSSLEVDDAVTNAVTVIANLIHRSSGAPAASFGASQVWKLDSSTNTLRSAGIEEVLWTTATNANESADWVLLLMSGGVAAAEKFRILSTGNINAQGKLALYNAASPTDGQLLIGKTSTSTFEAATLTGTALKITVTNGPGTITLTIPSPATLGDLNVVGTLAQSSGNATFSGSLGFFGVGAQTQQASGANLTNNVTSGGSSDVIANFTDLTTYSNDAATIRNDIYQLARKLKQVNDALRVYGLLT